MSIFIVIVALLFSALLITLWLTHPAPQVKTYRTVKAGKVENINAFPATTDKRDIIKNKRFLVGDKTVDPNEYEIFIVCGSSMSNYEINDGDAILVSRLYGNQRFEIKGCPILVFEIDINKDSIQGSYIPPVEFKLRKFITYINDSTEFDNAFDEIQSQNPDLIGRKEEIREKYNLCIEKYKGNNIETDNIVLIMSSTLDTEIGMVKYSFHPIKFLYGQVEYAIPSDAIR